MMARRRTQNVYWSLMYRVAATRPSGAWTANSLWALALFVGLLTAWQISVRLLHIPDIILPAPADIAEYLVRRENLFLKHLLPTFLQTVWGFVLAVIGGVLLAILVSVTEFGRKAVMPLLVVAQIVPKIAVAPLLMLWFGLGDLSRILIAFLVAFFPMVINTASGLNSVSEEVALMGKAFARSQWDFFLKIQFPHAIPYILDGMKVSITLSITGVIVAEFVSSQSGLGYLIMFANGRLDTTMMMAAIVVLSVMGLLLYGLVAVLARVIVYWKIPKEK
jgi:NitT/TauT family transport system permease protein